MSNTNRYVLITGCSTGIGYCLASGLRVRGYRVIASCRGDEDVARLSKEGFETMRIDLADERNVDQAVDRVRERTRGSLYGLINNGAYGQPGAMIDIRREVLREQFETNVFGTQQLTNGLLPTMLENRAGRVVQISSVLGFICLRFRGPYNASKYALESARPRIRYPVTVPTRVMALLKRLLTDRGLDSFLDRQSERVIPGDDGSAETGPPGKPAAPGGAGA